MVLSMRNKQRRNDSKKVISEVNKKIRGELKQSRVDKRVTLAYLKMKGYAKGSGEATVKGKKFFNRVSQKINKRNIY